MDGLAAFYTGRVNHIRHTPFTHKLDYPIWMLAVDIDRLAELEASSALFRHNRFGVFALHDRDHGNRDSGPLRPYVEAALKAQNLGAYASRIVFMTIPRLFGYAFSPISFFFCYNEAGEMGAVLHQVKNTFGDQIGYLMPTGSAATHPKEMHVSPFFDMAGGYRFALTEPEQKFAISIIYGTGEKPRLTATMTLRRIPWNRRSRLKILVTSALIPLAVVVAIHWHALKLWLKGAKFYPVPKNAHKKIASGETI
jgi:DUF1365 family protein